jgi:hypothetical protein
MRLSELLHINPQDRVSTQQLAIGPIKTNSGAVRVIDDVLFDPYDTTHRGVAATEIYFAVRGAATPYLRFRDFYMVRRGCEPLLMRMVVHNPDSIVRFIHTAVRHHGRNSPFGKKFNGSRSIRTFLKKFYTVRALPMS